MSVKERKIKYSHRVCHKDVNPRTEGTYAAFIKQEALRDAQIYTSSDDDNQKFHNDDLWCDFEPTHCEGIFKGKAYEIIKYVADKCGTHMDNVYLDPIDNMTNDSEWIERG